MHKLAITSVISLFVATFTASSATAEPLRAHEASYRASITKGISLTGSATRTLAQTNDGHWRYTFVVDSSIATISENSNFTLADSQIIPTSYRYALTGMLLKDRQQTVAFNWQKEQAREQYKDQSWTVPIQLGLLDRLSYQLQLQTDISQKNRAVDASNAVLPENIYRYNVLHKGEVRHYQFKQTARETIDTALGKKQSILVEKVRDKGKARETKLWFDQAPPFALLRMIQVEPDGEAYEINIEKLHQP